MDFLFIFYFRFRLPEGNLNKQRLQQFLGADINDNVQSVLQPTTPAPNAFEFLPLDGFASGGGTSV